MINNKAKIIRAIISFTLLFNNVFFVHAEEPENDFPIEGENTDVLYEEEQNTDNNASQQDSNFTDGNFNQTTPFVENIKIEEQPDNNMVFEINDISSELLNEYIEQLNEITNEGKYNLSDVIFAKHVSNISSEQSISVFAEEINNLETYNLYEVANGDITKIQYNISDSSEIVFLAHNADYLFVINSNTREITSDCPILSPNVLINIEDGTEQPEEFTTEAVNNKEILDIVNERLSLMHQRSLSLVSMVKVNFVPDFEINRIENKVFNNETGEYETVVRSGYVYFVESNIEYDLSKISFLKTMWVSEDLSEVKRLNHSVIGNDIHFSATSPGYVLVLEAQWVSDTPKEEKGFTFMNALPHSKIKKENTAAAILYAINASPTSENNLSVTINWVNDTEGTRASSTTIHVIRGILTVNGISPDSNGNVNVSCIYGSLPETSSNCYTIGTDIPANVDWEALDAQKEQIAELKQRLGIVD